MRRDRNETKTGCENEKGTDAAQQGLKILGTAVHFEKQLAGRGGL